MLSNVATGVDCGRRLSSRKGSISAPDPFAHNAKLDTPRGLASRLTIMRVSPSSDGLSLAAEDVITVQRPRLRSSTTSALPSASGSSPTKGSARTESAGKIKRMSFASSSFSRFKLPPDSSPSISTPSSPERSFTTKRGMNPTPLPSPQGSSPSQTRRPSLSAQQICDLAQTSFKTVTTQSPKVDAPQHSASSSPLSPRPRIALPAEDQLYDSSSNLLGSTSPFTPLPESHYLPFVDRPTEIVDLLSSNANKRLMALLRQTFPLHLRDSDGDADEQDPTTWSFPRLASFITDCPRSKCADDIWVTQVRCCIRARSEVVWERLKDIIGVPPELDTEEGIAGNQEPCRDIPVYKEEVEDAWVEPIFPTSPVSPIANSPTDIEESGLGYGGRLNSMETIGEGEEEDSAATVNNPRTNSLDDESTRMHPTEPHTEPIHALRLHTHPRFSDTSSRSVMSGTEMRLERSLPEGHISHGVPSVHVELHRSPSFDNVRSSSVERPEFERGPGNPLFPSNFGRLSIGPTLPANNPALRQQASPSSYEYSSRQDALAIPTDSADRLRHRFSGGSDYAVTLRSESGSDKNSVPREP